MEETLIHSDDKEPSLVGQNRSNTWKKSSMHHVLTQYGYQPTEREQATTKKSNTKAPTEQKPKKKKKTSFAFQDDYDKQRQNARRERNFQVYNEVEMLRDYYYDMYMTKLREKIDRQRAEIKKKSQAIENKIKAKEEQERRESHFVKKRLERHDLNHNEEFVMNIPKSDYYKILAIQRKLDDQGLLQTQEEKDEFWKDVRRPHMLNKYLKAYNPFPKTQEEQLASVSQSNTYQDSQDQSRSRTSSFGSGAEEKQAQDYRPMTQIEETHEPSRPVTREMTTERPVSKGKETPRKRDLEPHVIAKLAAAELDRKYPQMELPPLSCFEVEDQEDNGDSEEVLREMEAEHRRKERLLFVKRLRRMYHLSQSNTATTKRIMSGQDKRITADDLQNPGIADIIALDEITQEADIALGHIQPSPPPATSQRPWTKHLRSAPSRSIQPIKEESTDNSRVNSAVSDQSLGATKAEHTKVKTNVQPLPLSLEALTNNNGSLLESKCLSTLWTNYLHVGKSKFAPLAQS